MCYKVQRQHSIRERAPDEMHEQISPSQINLILFPNVENIVPHVSKSVKVLEMLLLRLARTPDSAQGSVKPVV